MVRPGSAKPLFVGSIPTRTSIQTLRYSANRTIPMPVKARPVRKSVAGSGSGAVKVGVTLDSRVMDENEEMEGF